MAKISFSSLPSEVSTKILSTGAKPLYDWETTPTAFSCTKSQLKGIFPILENAGLGANFESRLASDKVDDAVNELRYFYCSRNPYNPSAICWHAKTFSDYTKAVSMIQDLRDN